MQGVNCLNVKEPQGMFYNNFDINVEQYFGLIFLMKFGQFINT